MAEQKKQTELSRAKAIAKKEKESAYHHVPKVAAAAFERTTTPVVVAEKVGKKKSVHKLGQVALKHYVEENALPMPSSFNLQKTLAMDQARKQRDLVGDRNQFQWTRHLEDAAKLDRERNLSKVPRRTFGADNLDVPQAAPCSRPLSTGDLNWEDLDASDPFFHNKPKTNAPIPIANERQDWEQCDQVPVEVHRSVKERMNPFLRKTESMWTLKSRKKPKPYVLSKMSRSAPTSDIKQKRTFFGLFKR